MRINVLEYFLETYRRCAEKTALVDYQGEWDFRALGMHAGAIANGIVERTQSTNQPIAIYLPKSREAVAAILATLFSGNCYAPLDAKAPSMRTTAIITRLNPILIITSSALARTLAETGIDNNRLLIIEELTYGEMGFPTCWQERIDTDPAYIIHTSGSTGVPKGVAITHRAAIDFIEWACDCFDINENCVIGSQAPLIFDTSTLDLYSCFRFAAPLYIIPEELFLFPIRLLEYLAQHAINFIFWVPSVLVNVANRRVLSKVTGLGLRTILFAGEVMPAKQLNEWRLRFPDALFANLYGPTETTVISAYYILDRPFEDHESIPIGQPCRNTAVMILDENSRPVRGSEPGELCVRGSSLALGYWNNPDQTDAVFIKNPLNGHYKELIYKTGDIVYKNDRGEIVFTGRKDSQIKHQGYRIELGEIETAVRALPDVVNACVLYNERTKEITLFYQTRSELSISSIRKQISERLPKYMLPTAFHQLQELPINPSGKIDRQELKRKLKE